MSTFDLTLFELKAGIGISATRKRYVGGECGHCNLSQSAVSFCLVILNFGNTVSRRATQRVVGFLTLASKSSAPCKRQQFYAVSNSAVSFLQNCYSAVNDSFRCVP